MRLTVSDMTHVAIMTSLICIASLILKIGGEAVVPFSILPLMVMMTGAILGSRLGALSVGLFVLIGLTGIPVFAKMPYGGLTYVLQPTFGFLLGGILAAYVVGAILHKPAESGLTRYMLAMAAGIAVMYVIGIPYLYGIIRFVIGKPFSLWQAVKIGLLPFIATDMIKGAIAAAAAKAIHIRLVRNKSL